MLKIISTVTCANISSLLNNMLSHRFLQVFLGNQCSKWRRLNNGLPQGSVLAPILFNLYMSDLPSSSLNMFQYADDITLTHQARKFEECKIHLDEDLETKVCVFHLGTHAANRKLTFKFENTLITHVDHSISLGMSLDRTLSYK
jgi:hypothetical protein